MLKEIHIATCVSLSAAGSSILPTFVIKLKRRAINPSKTSVKPEANKIAAEVMYCFEKYEIMKQGIKNMRTKDRMLGILKIFSFSKIIHFLF